MTENPEQKSQSEGTETPVNPPSTIIEPLAPPYRVVLYLKYEELRAKLDEYWAEHGEALTQKFKVKTKKEKGGAQPSARKLLEKKIRYSKLYGSVLSKIIIDAVDEDIMFLEGLELFNYPPSEEDPWPQVVSVVYFVPELQMKGTLNWALKRPPLPPEEDEWERRQKEVQRQYRVIEPDESGEGITLDHQVLLDVTASVEGEAYANGTFQGQLLEVGVLSIQELKTALLEHKKGDLFEITFESHGDPEVAGKKVDAVVKVHDLKIIRTPEINDELAKDAGFEDMVDFRKRFHQDYSKYVKNAEQATATDHILGQIMMQSKVPSFPEEWLETNINRMIKEHLTRFNGNLKQGMAAIGAKDEEKFKQAFKGQFYRDYMQQLALRTYCKMYKIEKTDSDEMFASILSQVKWTTNEEATMERVGS